MAKCTSTPDNITPYAKKLCDESEKINTDNNSDKIISMLEEALTDSPESRTVILKLAAAYQKAGSPGRAVKILENAATAYPDDAELQHRLADSYAERKWNKKAMQQYLDCIEKFQLYPELIQDFSEFCMELHENDTLSISLMKILSSTDKFSDIDVPAMCFAMLYSNITEYTSSDKESDISSDYIDTFLASHDYLASIDFFISLMTFLADSPNEPAILPLINYLIDTTMKKYIPDITKNPRFLTARANFEVSNIMFNNDVSALTVFAARTVKMKFECNAENKNELAFLIFRGKLDLINESRTKDININTFKLKYVYLWSLISDFVTEIINAPDLRKHTENIICSFFRNASPELIAIAQKHIPEKEFLAFMSLSKVTVVQKKPATAKVPPNAPCPCGSGKKYKKCCGLS